MNAELVTHLSLIKISGQDAESFLQGQLTNDVAKLTNSWQYAGYCNPKGRLLALFQIWRQDGDFFALIANDLTEAVSKRLRMYVMRSKVLVEILEDRELVGISRQTATADNNFQADLRQSNHGDVVQSDDAIALIINERALIVRPAGATPDSALELDSNGVDWLKADIFEGLPRLSNATIEEFIPQMLNLDLLGGISFKKGCYTGQEIVARMHYLGKLKQRMFVCDAADDNSLYEGSTETTKSEAGDKVYADASLDKVVGTLVSVDHESKTALAVLRLDSLNAPLHLKSNQQLLTRKQQPYDIPV